MANELAALALSLPAAKLTKVHFQALIDRWRAEWTKATVYQYRRELKKLAKHIGAITGRPDLADDMPRARRPECRTIVATPQEIEQLKAVSKGWMRLFITIQMATALRRSDALRLCAAHLSADATHGKCIRLTQQKTGRLLILPISPALSEAIDALPPSDNPNEPFVDRAAGHRITIAAFGHEWKATRKRAGVNPELNSHDLRRTLAVSLYEISNDLRVVEQMLGHKSLTSTITYLEHRDPAKLRPLLERLWTPKGPVQ